MRRGGEAAHINGCGLELRQMLDIHKERRKCDECKRRKKGQESRTMTAVKGNGEEKVKDGRKFDIVK